MSVEIKIPDGLVTFGNISNEWCALGDDHMHHWSGPPNTPDSERKREECGALMGGIGEFILQNP